MHVPCKFQSIALCLLTASWIGAVSGCSALGLSLYPSTTKLTTEAAEVLSYSRIPNGIARENAKAVLPSHTLQPGDAVLIEPINFESDLRLPADQIVLADGSIDLGPYGRVILAGRTLEESEYLIEQQIRLQLRSRADSCRPNAVDPSDLPLAMLPNDCDGIAINVRLLEPVHQFYVLGEVNAPGAYPLTGAETVLDAIVSAGGLSSSANPCQILLARPTDPCECRITLPVCYREIVQLGNTATNYQLQPGDRVFVPSRSCLDELMFWKASRACPRCSQCNQACRNPESMPARTMMAPEEVAIAPGSSSWDSSDQELLKANLKADVEANLVPATPPAVDSARTNQGSAGISGTPVIEEVPNDPLQPAASRLDGELDFEHKP